LLHREIGLQTEDIAVLSDAAISAKVGATPLGDGSVKIRLDNSAIPVSFAPVIGRDSIAAVAICLTPPGDST
jgi:hypothetical protein